MFKIFKKKRKDEIEFNLQDYVRIPRIKKKDLTQKKSKEDMEKMFLGIERLVLSKEFKYFEDWINKQIYWCIYTLLETDYTKEQIKAIKLQNSYQVYMRIKQYFQYCLKKAEEKRKEADNLSAKSRKASQKK